MKERPILFSAPMVRALLNGEKTQTRRIAKEKNKADHPRSERNDSRLASPFGHAGDRLWVKETWSTQPEWDHLKPSELNAEQLKTLCYHADGQQGGKTRSSLFLPRRASRILLEIVHARKERLQDIHHADAIAEGMSGPEALADYARLWDRINGKGSWSGNPWVWVVTFRAIH